MDLAANELRQPASRPVGTVILVAAVVTLGGLISTAMSVHMFALLGAAGLSLGAALAIATLIGPSQIGARLIDLALARRHHPIWTMAASVGLVAAGIGLLAAGLPLYVLIVVLYGAGIGLASIAHGTVPLALFGAENYPSIMGKIALPALLAQAAAPAVGSLLIETIGARHTAIALAAIASANVLLIAGLVVICRRGTKNGQHLIIERERERERELA
jgi:MFS family permease